MKYLILFLLFTNIAMADDRYVPPLSYFMEKPEYMDTLGELERGRARRQEEEFREEQRERWRKEDRERQHEKTWGYKTWQDEAAARDHDKDDD